MKAKLYTRENQMEVVVSNKVYSSVEKEAKADFLTRVKALLETDFDEAIDIAEVPFKTLQKLDDAFVIEAYKASKGPVQEALLKDILAERKIEVTKIEKTARKKVEKLDIEEVKKSEDYLVAKSNVGKLAEFTTTKGEEIVKGIVKSISLNKTNTIIYYNVQAGEKLRCCTAKNETLKFHEF